MSSNASKYASKMPTVHGSVFFPIQTFVKCSRAAEASKKPSAQIALADKENVKARLLYVLSKVIFYCIIIWKLLCRSLSYIAPSYLSLFLSLFLYPFLSPFLSLFLSLFLSPFLYLFLSLFISPFLFPFLFLCLSPMCLSFSISLYLCFCLFLLLPTSFFVSFSILFSGKCNGNVSHTEENVLTKEDCLTACQNLPSCR